MLYCVVCMLLITSILEHVMLYYGTAQYWIYDLLFVSSEILYYSHKFTCTFELRHWKVRSYHEYH